MNVFCIRLGALFQNPRRSFNARPKHESALRWARGRGNGVSVHSDDVHEGAVFGVKARFEVDAGVAGNLANFRLVVNANNAFVTSLFSWPSNRKRTKP